MTHMRWISPIAGLLLLVTNPAVSGQASGEGEQLAASPVAGPLAWSLMGFGTLIIAGVGAVLFTGRSTRGQKAASDFDRMTGFSGYLGKMRLFSHNARLYIVHIVGMDVIYGTWNVVFNLYLLAAGIDVAFVGLRILVTSVAGAVAAVPSGLISDRIGSGQTACLRPHQPSSTTAPFRVGTIWRGQPRLAY